MERHRLINGTLTDIGQETEFYVDPDGRKHAEQHDPGWPSLACAWDDELIKDGGSWRIRTATDNVAALADEAMRAVNRAAGEARSKYITIAPGQELVYMAKDKQAREFKAAGYTGTVPAFVAAEAAATGATDQVACDSIIAQADALIAKGAAIDQQRRTASVQIEAALQVADTTAITTARDAAIAEIMVV